MIITYEMVHKEIVDEPDNFCCVIYHSNRMAIRLSTNGLDNELLDETSMVGPKSTSHR